MMIQITFEQQNRCLCINSANVGADNGVSILVSSADQ